MTIRVTVMSLLEGQFDYHKSHLSVVGCGAAAAVMCRAVTLKSPWPWWDWRPWPWQRCGHSPDCTLCTAPCLHWPPPATMLAWCISTHKGDRGTVTEWHWWSSFSSKLSIVPVKLQNRMQIIPKSSSNDLNKRNSYRCNINTLNPVLRLEELSKCL